ncbi:MAG TPA: hypothetical protein VN902_10530, partial [Candidatus Acidoferrales bacterium]|nr:hypothetical protein [Candidatus Acidoferrales bacterium]
ASEGSLLRYFCGFIRNMRAGVVIFTLGAFLLLPFVFSYIELIRLPSIRMCAPFLIRRSLM